MQNIEVLKNTTTKADCRTLAEFFAENRMCPQRKEFCEDEHSNIDGACVKCWLYFLTSNTLKQETQKESKPISESDTKNQSKVVKLLQNAFLDGRVEYNEADSIAIWLDNIIKRNSEH